MTALDKFIRLETLGYWFEAGRQEGREVIVSFGDATLQLTSLKDQPLTHWSLLATQRIGTRGEAVIYSADPEQHEILEIEDRDMIRAISAVTSALAPARAPGAGRWLWRGALACLIAFGLAFAPPLITKTTTMLTPPARLATLSDQVQNALQATYGPACNGWLGQHALNDFSEKLFPAHPVKLMVFADQPYPILALPGDAISFSRAAIEAAETPKALATMAALAWAMSQNQRPLAAYIEALGPFGALRALVSGTLPPPSEPPAPIPPSGEDFIVARDYLSSMGYSVFALQNLASQNGIGMPIAVTPRDVTDFSFDDFSVLQNICAE